METYYYTVDSDLHIIENAVIEKIQAPSVDDAKREILKIFGESYPVLEDDEELVIIEGGFDDCWIKVYEYTPNIVFYPFSKEQLLVQKPNEVPGDNYYWITPRPTVYVPNIIKRN